MKEGKEKIKGIVKGTPSAVLLSILIHAALFLLAGVLVVFTVTKVKEAEFEPPQTVERPRMKLRKPKVRMKKTSRPKSAVRITARKPANMPDLQLPELTGIGDGLGDGVGGDGFGIMPDFSEVTIFGSGQSIGNDFEGRFYDTKRYRNGTKNAGISRDETIRVLLDFMEKGWNPAAFSKYYCSPRKLYTTHFLFPQVPATAGPEAFGQVDIPGYGWLAHYKGQIVYPEDIRFRFWAQGDNLIAVRVDGEIAVLASWPGWSSNPSIIEPYFTHLWHPPTSAQNRRYPMGNNYAVVGDWIELKAGEPMDMEVLVSEMSGGITCFMLCVEVEGVEYPKNPFGGGPTLPAFKTEELGLDMKERIWANLHEGDASLENGPVFKDYFPSETSLPAETPVPEPEEGHAGAEDGPRVWTLRDDNTFEAEFLICVGDQAVFRSARGKQRKIPLAELSEESVNEIQLNSPPELSLEFRYISRQLPEIEVTPYWAAQPLPADKEYTFGVRIKNKGTIKGYDHPLAVKFYAIGDEVDGDNFVLLDRREETIIPTRLNAGEIKYLGDPVRLKMYPIRFDDRAPMRGIKYGGYLIAVTDSRGQVVQYRASSDWLFDIRHKLDDLPTGTHFDKEGTRVCPPRPTESDRPRQFWE
jgi:hypothetical protein